MRNDFLDLANATVAHQLTCETEARIGALLRTRLPDSSIVLRKLDQLLTFTNGECHRLFTIDILALAHSHTGNHCMPVVRGSDDNGIDVLALEHLTVVFEELRLAAVLLLNGIDVATHAACVNIAESSNFDALLAH